MTFLLYTLHVLICFFLIAVVLLQQGKGADLSVFGGGATQTAFGARGAASLLHKLTVGSFVGFILTTLAIGVLQEHKAASLLNELPEVGVEAPADSEEAEPEGALPAAGASDDGSSEEGSTEGEDAPAAGEGGEAAVDGAEAGGDESASGEPEGDSAS